MTGVEPPVWRRPDPTPAEIKAACERIRAGWSDAERRKRLVVAEKPAEVPVVETLVL